MNSPFIKTTYMLTFPPHLFEGVSQSYLKCCLPGCSPQFAPNKTELATLMLGIIFKSASSALQPPCVTQQSRDLRLRAIQNSLGFYQFIELVHAQENLSTQLAFQTKVQVFLTWLTKLRITVLSVSFLFTTFRPLWETGYKTGNLFMSLVISQIYLPWNVTFPGKSREFITVKESIDMWLYVFEELLLTFEL